MQRRQLLYGDRRDERRRAVLTHIKVEDGRRISVRMAARSAIGAHAPVAGNFEHAVPVEFAICGLLSEHSGAARRHLAVLHRAGEYWRHENHKLGFGRLITHATEGGSDIREFAQERRELSEANTRRSSACIYANLPNPPRVGV